MRKKSELPPCPVATTVSLIGSKWKLLIIKFLLNRPYRFNELQRACDGISQKVLTSSLKELILDGLVDRTDFKTNPPHVEYSLSKLGEKMKPIIFSMADFGNYYKQI